MLGWGAQRWAGRLTACACAASVLSPVAVLAQIVRYETLTLVESAYLYDALQVQAILRLSSLRHLPQIIVVCCTMWLFYRRVTTARPQPFMGIVAYVISCTLILVLFWPEAAPRFFGGTLMSVRPDEVQSYVANQNGMAADDAAASGLVPPALATVSGAAVPRFFDLLLRVTTSVPLQIGAAIDPRTATTGGITRPFERVPVLSEWLQFDPPKSVRTGIGEFVGNCLGPGMMKLVGANAGTSATALTREDSYPWGAKLNPILGAIEIAAQRGWVATVASWIGLSTAPARVTCGQFYQGLENNMLAAVRNVPALSGGNMETVVNSTLGITGQDLARFYVQREIDRNHAAAVNDPNRVHTLKVAADGVQFASDLAKFDFTAPFASLAGATDRQLSRVTNFLGIGSFVVRWAPHIVGIAMFTVVALFPVVLLWSLFPGQHFKPLVNYFLMLIFVCSTPLWWAFVNIVATVGRNMHPPGANVLANMVGVGVGEYVYIVVTVLGIIIVPMIQAVLLFGSWRAIGGIWHA